MADFDPKAEGEKYVAWYKSNLMYASASFIFGVFVGGFFF